MGTDMQTAATGSQGFEQWSVPGFCNGMDCKISRFDGK